VTFREPLRRSKDDPRSFLTRIAPYVERDGGRNLKKISDELSIPYQTLRARFLQLNEMGISILAVVNPEKIGLQRMRAEFKLSPDVTSFRSLFGGLHQSAGLDYYARSFYTQFVDTDFLIPSGKERELERLLEALEEMNLITNLSKVQRVVWKDSIMMPAKYYDYADGAWDVDFSSLRPDPSIRIPEPCSAARFDHTDVLIIRALQMDPLVKSVDLSRELSVTPEDVSYHLNKHVFGLQQVPRFRLKWAGPKEAWSKHSILGITYLFPELSEKETRNAMSVLTAVPFTWNHMKLEDGTYFAEVLVPISFLSETMRYVSDNLRTLDLTPLVHHVDWSCTSAYTVPHTMHDQNKGWKLKAEDSLGYTIEMIRTYR
jgi:DNA-binding Lrp family transcriptional regulator